MTPSLLLVAWSILFFLIGQNTFAAESPSLNSNPVGVGGLVAQTGAHGTVRSGVLFEASNHFRQRVGNLGVRQYGFAQSRAEWTNPFAIHLHASVGISLLGIREGEHLSFHLGIEPLSGRVAWRPAISGASFYQWHPMISAGGQLAWGGCRSMGILRLGGSLGNLNSPGIAPRAGSARGVLFALNCERMDLGTEALRLEDRHGSATFRTIDLTWNVPDSRWKMGTRWEWTGRAPGQLEDERRWMFIMRMNPFEE